MEYTTQAAEELSTPPLSGKRNPPLMNCNRVGKERKQNSVGNQVSDYSAHRCTNYISTLILFTSGQLWSQVSLLRSELKCIPFLIWFWKVQGERWQNKAPSVIWLRTTPIWLYPSQNLFLLCSFRIIILLHNDYHHHNQFIIHLLSNHLKVMYTEDNKNIQYVCERHETVGTGMPSSFLSPYASRLLYCKAAILTLIKLTSK